MQPRSKFMLASQGTETTARSGGKFEGERSGIVELYTASCQRRLNDPILFAPENRTPAVLLPSRASPVVTIANAAPAVAAETMFPSLAPHAGIAHHFVR